MEQPLKNGTLRTKRSDRMATHQQHKGNTGNTGAAAMESAKQTAGKAGEAAKDAASNMASNVAGKVSDAGAYIAHKAEDATAAVGGEMKSLAGTLRDKGPHDGMLGNASSAVANTLESYGRELEEHGLSGMADDITNTIRRHPVPAILIGIGLGFCLARMMSK
jgi:hypothetical protein